jgi:oligopeptide transport system ATP-binding protein
MSDSVLSVEGLRVHFPVRTGGIFSSRTIPLKAVDGVSFTLAKGETLGVVGESGCGKSTLGRAVLRLIEPTAGKVVWMGEDLATLEPSQMRDKRRDLQLIFQDPLASLNPRMTVGDILREPLSVHAPSLSREDANARVEAMMREVGLLPEMKNRYPHEFSGGQCQRISIARAMILNPKLVICDEPVSALDVSIQAQIVNLLKRLQRDHGVSLIFISHDLSVVRYISHRILVLYLGRMMELADRDSLFANPLNPYTRTLIDAVPIPDPEKERAKAVSSASGDLPSPLNPPSGCVFRTRCPQASELCARATPEWRELKSDHRVACHFAELS